jgi:2'-5' RNA ligase
MTPGRRSFGPPPAEDPARPRLFFAVPLPDETREAIRPIRDAVQAGVGDGHARIRWVRIESLHLTVRFLGPTPLELAPMLGDAAERAAAGIAPFDVTIGGAGGFPAGGRPRTLWLGLRAGADGLAHLAKALDAALPPGGHDERSHCDNGHGDDAPNGGGHAQARAFTPHLTIARTDGLRLAGEAARALAAAASDHEWSFVADQLVLFRSHLGQGPAWYEPLTRVSLG